MDVIGWMGLAGVVGLIVAVAGTRGERASSAGSTTRPRARTEELRAERQTRRAHLSVGMMALALVTVSVFACGGAAAAQISTETDHPDVVSVTDEPEDQVATSDLILNVSDAMVAAALGEQPDAACETSVLSGSERCVWTATDGSWLKVERGEQIETPTPDTFQARMVDTLGVDEPVPGLGKAAYRHTSDHGARVAVFIADGLVLWVVIDRAGDEASQAALVVDIAKAVVVGA